MIKRSKILVTRFWQLLYANMFQIPTTKKNIQFERGKEILKLNMVKHKKNMLLREGRLTTRRMRQNVTFTGVKEKQR